MDSERVRPALDPTGDPRVDAAIAGLAALDQVDVAERPAVLAEIHGRLREILGELGDAAGRHGELGDAAGRHGGQGRPGEPGRRGEQDELSQGPRPRPEPPGPEPPRPGPPRP